MTTTGYHLKGNAHQRRKARRAILREHKNIYSWSLGKNHKGWLNVRSMP